MIRYVIWQQSRGSRSKDKRQWQEDRREMISYFSGDGASAAVFRIMNER